jgi:transposase, IS5 family
MGTVRWRAEVAHYLPLIARVLVQTRRRVLDGEIVPASEKLVSLFEPHADIIVKSLPRRKPGVVVRFSTDTSSTWRPAKAD